MDGWPGFGRGRRWHMHRLRTQRWARSGRGLVAWGDHHGEHELPQPLHVDDAGRIAELPGPTIESALLDAGATVIFVHTRGHGSSGKPHGPESYRGAVHADDVRAVLAELDVGEVDIVGYSMGAITAARLLDDRRVRTVVLSGTEPSMFISGSTKYDETRSLGQCFVTNEWSDHPEFKPSRAQARVDPNHDFAAIGAALIGLEPPPPGWLSTASVPVLVLNGGNDDPDDAAARLAALIPGATAVVAGDGTHALAPSDPKFQHALVEFLRATW